MSIVASTPNSDRLFRVLIEHNPEVIALLSPEGTVLYTSPSIQRVLGYTPEQCMATSAWAIVHSDDRAALAHTCQHLLALSGLMKTHQFRCRHTDTSLWKWRGAFFGFLSGMAQEKRLVVVPHAASSYAPLSDSMSGYQNSPLDKHNSYLLYSL